MTNKIEKAFVDYWLLDYDEAMSRFDDPISNLRFVYFSRAYEPQLF